MSEFALSNLEIPLSTTSSCAEEGPKSGNHQAWPKHSTNGCDLSKIFIGKAQNQVFHSLFVPDRWPKSS